MEPSPRGLRRCLISDWRCQVGEYLNPIGVDIAPYEGLEAVDYLDYIDGYGVPLVRYFHDIIETLNKVSGTQQLLDISAFPYDWRLPVWQYDWQQFKDHVENAVTTQQEKAVIVLHSLGGIALNWFLNTQVTSEWKHTHFKAVISINGAYGGSMKIARAIMSGYNPAEIPFFTKWGIPQFVTNADLRELSRRVGSLFLLTPHEEIYHPNAPVITMLDSHVNNTSTFSLSNWTKLTNDTEFITRATKSRELIKDIALKDPGIPTFCFWSRFDEATTERYYVYKDWDFNQDPEKSLTDGDGTLPIDSLRACTTWKSTVFASEIPNQDHMYVLRSSELNSAIERIFNQAFLPAPPIKVVS